MKNLNYKSIIFNISEFILVITSGLLRGYQIHKMILIMSLFTFVRQTIGGAKHYKSPYKCTVWSLLIMLALFEISNIDFVLGIGVTIFAAIILTTKGDVALFEYNAKVDMDKKSKYREMKAFVKERRDTDYFDDYINILEGFNERYADRYKFNFSKIFRLKFLEDKKYKEILEQANFNDNRDLTDALDIISISLHTYIETKEIKNGEVKEELTTKS